MDNVIRTYIPRRRIGTDWYKKGRGAKTQNHIYVTAMNDIQLTYFLSDITMPSREYHDVSNHQQLDWLFDNLFKLTWKHQCHASLVFCEDNPRWRSEFPHEGAAIRKGFPTRKVVIKFVRNVVSCVQPNNWKSLIYKSCKSFGGRTLKWRLETIKWSLQTIVLL